MTQPTWVVCLHDMDVKLSSRLSRGGNYEFQGTPIPGLENDVNIREVRVISFGTDTEDFFLHHTGWIPPLLR